MRPRVLYFLIFLVIAAQGRFASVVLSESLQLNSAQVGWVLGLGRMSSLLTTPYWTSRADSKGYRPVLKEMVALQLASYSLLLACKLWFMHSNSTVFALAMASRFLAYGCILPATSVLDAYTLVVIEDQEEYGRERMFGAAARALGNVLLGVCMDAQTTLDSLAVCGVLLVLSSVLFLVLVAYCLPDETITREEEEEPTPAAPAPYSASSFRFLVERPMALFLVCVALVMGVAASVAENLMFLFLRQDLQASYTLCGLTVCVAAGFEVPMLYWGKPLLAGYALRDLFLTSMGMIAARIWLNSIVTKVWVIVCMEPLQGFSNGLLQLASVAFVNGRVSASNAARGQGYTLMFRSLGNLVGATGGGMAMNAWGSSIMFSLVAGLVMLAMLALWLAGFDGKIKSSAERREDDEELGPLQQELLVLRPPSSSS